MAAVSRRPRLIVYAALALSLIAAACSLVKPVATPADRQEQAARLVRDGKHAQAAQVYADLAAELPATLVPTFLGAHEVPPEYRGNRDAYVRLVCEEMIPAVAKENLATSCDVFCEPGVFSSAEQHFRLAHQRGRPDRDLARSAARGAHGLDRVGQEIHEHPLDLDPVCQDRRQRLVQRELQRDVLAGQLPGEERRGLAGQAIEAELRDDAWRLGERRADAVDDVTGSPPRLDDGVQ